jgi:hypothetical protein
MHADDYVGDDFAARANGGYTELPESHVHFVVEECGEGVAYKWS